MTHLCSSSAFMYINKRYIHSLPPFLPLLRRRRVRLVRGRLQRRDAVHQPLRRVPLPAQERCHLHQQGRRAGADAGPRPSRPRRPAEPASASAHVLSRIAEDHLHQPDHPLRDGVRCRGERLQR